MLFKDRQQAGLLLGEKLTAYRGTSVRILGLSHGGVVVAVEVGRVLGKSVDALFVKKLSSLENPEYALGAVVLDDERNKKLHLRGEAVIIVDDGAATGKTMEAAVVWVRSRGARSIIVVLPVASRDALIRLRPLVDRLYVCEEDPHLTAVGAYYEDFTQVTDEDVVELLQA